MMRPSFETGAFSLDSYSPAKEAPTKTSKSAYIRCALFLPPSLSPLYPPRLGFLCWTRRLRRRRVQRTVAGLRHCPQLHPALIPLSRIHYSLVRLGVHPRPHSFPRTGPHPSSRLHKGLRPSHKCHKGSKLTRNVIHLHLCSTLAPTLVTTPSQHLRLQLEVYLP